MNKRTSKVERREKEELLDVPFNPVAFREEFKVNQEEITRIFSHLHQKYPIGEKREEAFNQLFIAFAELRVFQRWSIARVVRHEVKRRTGSARKADAVYRRLIEQGGDKAERMAIEMGINLKVKRGQFLYKWIEHILGQEYLSEGNRSRRFSSIDPDSVTHPSWVDNRRLAGFIPWSARNRESDPKDPYEGAGAWGVAANHESRHFPHFEDAPSCVGEHTYANAMCSIEDDLSEVEVMSAIHDGTDADDRFIIEKRFSGYTVREVQEQLARTKGLPAFSPQGILNRLSKIRAKPTTRAALAV